MEGIGSSEGMYSFEPQVKRHIPWQICYCGGDYVLPACALISCLHEEYSIPHT